MTLAQMIFSAAFLFVLIIIAVFGIVLITSAIRNDGGSYLNSNFLRRMMRSPEERSEFNRYAFYAHRFSGFSIFVFLCLHIVDVGLFMISPDLYNEVHVLYGTTLMRIFECGLLFAILFHTFNGLRLLAIDMMDLGLTASRRLLQITVGITLVLGLIGSIIIMRPVIT